MHLTYNTTDKVLCLDGICVEVKGKGIPKKLHAVEWDDNTGHLQFLDGTCKKLTAIKGTAWLENLVELHTKAVTAHNEEIAKLDNELEEYATAVKELEKDYLEMSPKQIGEILATRWTNLKLGLRVRESDDKVIGIDVLMAEGYGDGTGVKTLQTIRDLFEKAREDGVYLFSDVKPDIVDKEQYLKYLEKLGAIITRYPHANHMVFIP